MDYRVRLVIEMLQRDLHTSVELTRLSSSVGLTPSGLRLLFRKDLGVPPRHFLKQLRLDRARQLLGTELWSVKEIMAAVGCSDQSHFVKDFERAYGLSPCRYRQEVFRHRRNDASALRLIESRSGQ